MAAGMHIGRPVLSHALAVRRGVIGSLALTQQQLWGFRASSSPGPELPSPIIPNEGVASVEARAGLLDQLPVLHGLQK